MVNEEETFVDKLSNVLHKHDKFYKIKVYGEGTNVIIEKQKNKKDEKEPTLAVSTVKLKV